MQFRYAGFWDKMAVTIGIFCAVISGCGQPALALVVCRISNLMLTIPVITDEFRTKGFRNVYIAMGLTAVIITVNYLQVKILFGFIGRK